MNDEQKEDHFPDEKDLSTEDTHETSGQYLYKRLGLVGCIAVLVFTAIVIITCFTSAP